MGPIGRSSVGDGTLDAGNRLAFTPPMRVRNFALVVAAIALVGCAGSPDPIIDSWPVGEPSRCSIDARCEELVRVGLAGLDERDPGHAQVVAAELHSEGTFMDPATGGKVLVTRSGGCCRVLVIRLANGDTKAIGVGYPGVSRDAVAVPWEIAPQISTR